MPASLCIIVAALAAILLGCASADKVVDRAAAPASSAVDPADHAIESLIHRWFQLLSDPGADPSEFERFLPDERFELVIFDREIRSRSDLRRWLGELRDADGETRYDIEAIEVVSDAPPLHRAEVRVTRHSVGSDGLPHIARRAQIWQLRSTAGSAPIVLEAKEAKLLPFPGTGPRVVCF